MKATLVFTRNATIALTSLFVLTAACSNENAPTANPKAANAGAAATVKADVPAQCVDHPLMPAMPTAPVIGGRPLTEVECEAFTVTMIYGEAGASAKVILVDSKAPAPKDAGPLTDLLVGAQQTAFNSVVASMGMMQGVRQMAIETPGAVARLGGEDYLSVVMNGPTGEPVVIGVEPKDADSGVGPLMSVLKGRYALTILIEQEGVSGAAAALSTHQPYLAAMNLKALP